jgi:hypothetical protein
MIERTIRVLDASVEQRRLRGALDELERAHALPSEHLIEAFTVDGLVHETGEFHARSRSYVTWLILSSAEVVS